MVLEMLAAAEPAAALQGSRASTPPLLSSSPAAEIAEFEDRMSAQMLAVKVSVWPHDEPVAVSCLLGPLPSANCVAPRDLQTRAVLCVQSQQRFAVEKHRCELGRWLQLQPCCAAKPRCWNAAGAGCAAAVAGPPGAPG